MTSKSLTVPNKVHFAIAMLALVPLTGMAANAGNGPKAQIFAKFDLNKNGVIDGEEIAAVRKAFTAEPKGQFARYDMDHDGKLDDAEIAEIKPPGAGGKKGEKKDAAGKKTPEGDKPGNE